jgi:uncharacterized Rossmann fold enzyme
MKAVDIRAREILSRLGDNPVGVEVGVFRGGLSQRLLLNKPDLYLHMVDSWTTGNQQYIKSGDYHANLSQQEQDGYFEDSVRVTEFAADRRKVWCMSSVEAAEKFADESLDFVFLDADHSYEGCAEDIRAWRPKLKPDGILCGHDYDNKDYPDFGVKQAVDELGKVEIGEDTTWFLRERITVACVKWGTKYGAEYVNILRAMVAKNLKREHDFVCLTDDPAGIDKGIEIIPLPEGLEGWWNKLYLFSGILTGKILYLDLDVCITGSLDELVTKHGIIHDWNLPSYNSSVMVWRHGEHNNIWNDFTPDVSERLHGDQDWISELGGWPLLPHHWCVSYRLHATDWPPAGAKIVCFHGDPKPHDAPSEWVRLIWSKEGLSGPQFINRMNNDASVMLEQLEANLKRDLPHFKEQPEHDRTMILAGGGPSIKDMAVPAGDIFALNGAHDYLISKGIKPHYHVILDSRAENAAFVRHPQKDIKYLISGFCHADVFEALQEQDVTLWISDMDGVLELVNVKDDPVLVGGGATVGMKALYLGYLMGYRKFEIYGLDSCYIDDENHAYPQPMNDGERKDKYIVCGREFTCAPWMAKQAMEFQQQARMLASLGCQLSVHGDGLLAWILNRR